MKTLRIFLHNHFEKKLKNIYSYSARRALSNGVLKKEKKILLEFCIVCTLKALKILEYVSDFYENALGKVEIRIELKVWRLRRVSKIFNTLQQVAIVAVFLSYRKEAYVGSQCV